jgi:glucokinase
VTRRSVLAIDVGGTGIKAALVDPAGQISRRIDRSTPAAEGPDAVVAAVRATARELADASVVGAGVVVPGSVDVDAGIARYSANIGWRDVPIRDLLADDLGVPVIVEHDVRAAGIAEWTAGAARGTADCVVVMIGTGIAAAIRAGGSVPRGAMHLAGELGHVPVYPDGERCACGQLGCLETYASAAAVARRYEAACGRRADAREIVASLACDPVAVRVWDEATRTLGIALASYTLLLDPALIVLSGGLSGAGEALATPVRAELADRLTWRPAPPVVLSSFGSSAGLLGAGLLARQSIPS